MSKEENALSTDEMNDQDIILQIDGKEIVRLKRNGDFFVEGRKVINDLELYKGFKKFVNGVRL